MPGRGVSSSYQIRSVSYWVENPLRHCVTRCSMATAFWNLPSCSRYGRWRYGGMLVHGGLNVRVLFNARVLFFCTGTSPHHRLFLAVHQEPSSSTSRPTAGVRGTCLGVHRTSSVLCCTRVRRRLLSSCSATSLSTFRLQTTQHQGPLWSSLRLHQECTQLHCISPAPTVYAAPVECIAPCAWPVVECVAPVPA